jgi:osmotically-inducible protein OsmY
MNAAVPDGDLLKAVHDRLQRAGASQDRIRATVDHGTVKLMGALQFEMQRRSYLKVVSAIAGVHRIDDYMQVTAKKKKV